MQTGTDEKIRVLYVDDEINNLIAFSANFRKQFEIYTAATAKEGLDILAKKDVHIVITDQRMPGIKGVGFLESITKKYPDVMRMMLTGYSDIEAVIDAINKTHIFRYIAKPWNHEEIVEAIIDGYKAYRTKKEQQELINALKRTNEQLEFMLREKLIS